MSNTPFFDALIAEYDEKKRGEILKTLSVPFMEPVKPTLPKRSVAQLITPPEPDPEFAKQLQEFIQTAPMQILQGTPAGSFIKSLEVVGDGRGGLALEAEVMSPHPQIIKDQMEGIYGEVESDEEELYIDNFGPFVFNRSTSELKAEKVSEDLAMRQLDLYRSASPFYRQKTAEGHDDRFVPPMTEKTMPSWIAEEVRESNEALMDPDEFDPVPPYVRISENIHEKDLEGSGHNLPQFFEKLATKFHEDYPNAENMIIHRKDEIDGTITISVTGTTPEQTDESVNAASNTDSTSTANPLWVSHEE